MNKFLKIAGLISLATLSASADVDFTASTTAITSAGAGLTALVLVIFNIQKIIGFINRNKG